MGPTAGDVPTARGSGAEIARTLAETAARRRAVVLAGHSGDATLAEAALHDDAASVRSSALRALHRLDRLTRPAIEEAVADPDPAVRRTVAELAASWHDAEGPVDLLPLLRDPIAEVVEVAAWASGEIVPDPDAHADDTTTSTTTDVVAIDARVVEVLIELTTAHDDALVREAAVAALGAIGDDRGLDAILQATTDKATVRRRAVIALAPFDGERVDAALERALTDRDWQVRQAAEDLLA